MESFRLDDFLQENKAEQQQSNDDARPPRAECALKLNSGLDDAKGDDSHECAGHVADATAQQCSTDDYCRNGIEFQANARVCVSRGCIQDIHDPGETGAKTAECVNA